MRPLAQLLCLGITLVQVSACQGPRKAEPSAESHSALSASDNDSAGGEGACGQLQKKLCDATSEQSQTCTSAGTLLPLLTDAACSAALKDFATTEERLKGQASKCDELVALLCKAIGPETQTCEMVTNTTKTFPPERCVAMLEHTDEIIADLKKQEAALQPLDDAMQATIAAEDAPSFGAPTAKVTIVEFSDFQCPYCSRAAKVTQQIRDKYGDKVRFVFRQFPLSFHQNAQAAAEASLAAHSQGKFWEFHDQMFENQSALDRASLEGYASAVGMDMGKFKQALDSQEHAARVKADLELGEKVSVNGTPTMFINGQRAQNPTDFDSIAKTIDSLLDG